MPSKTDKQRRTAGQELNARRKGKRKRQSKATRPFGSASKEALIDYASKY